MVSEMIPLLLSSSASLIFSRAFRLAPVGAAVISLVLVAIAPPGHARVFPEEASVLRRIHIDFEWEASLGASGYDLQIVVDDGSSDPFIGGDLVLDESLDAAAPRHIVTSGLEFDAQYAWRVRAAREEATAWGTIHRFGIEPIPDEMPEFSVVTQGGAIQPGFRLFDVRPLSGDLSRNYILAVEISGKLIWFQPEDGRISDARLLDDGTVLTLSAGRAVILTLDGERLWESPDDPSLHVHHEVFPMRNGDVLTLVADNRVVDTQGQDIVWIGDKVVIFSRQTGDVIWQWAGFDHISLLDFDPTTLEGAIAGTSPWHDWTHGNAAVFDKFDSSIYLSFRQVSRIVKLDYPSGEIIYNMGFDMPSGDVGFGHDLFSFQHAPEMQPNGNMLLFDNGNRRGNVVHTEETGVSKVVELEFGEASEEGEAPTEASIAWEWTVPDYNSRVGDADRLPNGNTLVTAGVQTTLYEVDSFGNEVWRLEATASGDYTFSVHRAQQIDALIPEHVPEPEQWSLGFAAVAALAVVRARRGVYH